MTRNIINWVSCSSAKFWTEADFWPYRWWRYWDSSDVSVIDKQSGYFIMTPISCNYYIIKPKQLAKFSNWSTTWNKTTNANKLIISNLQRWTSKKYITYVSIHDWKLQGNTARPGKVCWEYSDWEYLPYSGPHSHILIDLEEKINDKEKNINSQPQFVWEQRVPRPIKTGPGSVRQSFVVIRG